MRAMPSPASTTVPTSTAGVGRRPPLPPRRGFPRFDAREPLSRGMEARQPFRADFLKRLPLAGCCLAGVPGVDVLLASGGLDLVRTSLRQEAQVAGRPLRPEGDGAEQVLDRPRLDHAGLLQLTLGDGLHQRAQLRPRLLQLLLDSGLVHAHRDIPASCRLRASRRLRVLPSMRRSPMRTTSPPRMPSSTWVSRTTSQPVIWGGLWVAGGA